MSSIEGDIFHLWHGDRKNRMLRERFAELSRFAFDPERDIRLGTSGLWHWNSDKRDMHEAVKGFFKHRREDG